MSFNIKRKEAVSKAIRRLGRKRIERALRCLEDCGQPEAIHRVRQEIKKARAVLRLVQTDIGRKANRRQMKRLRKAARKLAPSRDAHVIAMALEELTGHFKGRLEPGAWRQARIPLQRAADRETRRFATDTEPRAVRQILRRVEKDFDELKLDRKGWKAISTGLRTAYREGRRAYRTARKDGSAENFHEWRKRAKELWYDVRLLKQIAPGPMKAAAADLKALGTFLGDDHDLFMLQETMTKRGDEGAELEQLNPLIAQRQKELRAASLAIGSRFYAEKPSVFCERLSGYWKAWRKGNKSSGRVSATS